MSQNSYGSQNIQNTDKLVTKILKHFWPKSSTYKKHNHHHDHTALITNLFSQRKIFFSDQLYNFPHIDTFSMSPRKYLLLWDLIITVTPCIFMNTHHQKQFKTSWIPQSISKLQTHRNHQLHNHESPRAVFKLQNETERPLGLTDSISGTLFLISWWP